MATDGRRPRVVPREPTAPARRLFFALWPDEAMRRAMMQSIHKAAGALGGSDPRHGCGRSVPADNLHVTLAFLGSVPERRLPELAEAARAVAEAPGSLGGTGSPAAPLELLFDRLEYWRAAHLLCALPVEPATPVADLARKLQDALLARGFTPDLKPFRPHVTVARKVARASAAEKMDPVRWRFTELALIESCALAQGALYSVVESHSLCSGQKGCK